MAPIVVETPREPHTARPVRQAPEARFTAIQLVIEIWDHPINDRPDLLSADGIHFSASGQAVMAAEVIKTLASVRSGAA